MLKFNYKKFGTSILVSLCSLSTVPAAGEVSKLKNFRPGFYQNSDPDSEYCDDAEISYYETNQDLISIGDEHLMSLVPATDSVASDLADEKGCRYETEDKVEIAGLKTILTYHERLVCRDGVRKELRKTSTIDEFQIHLSVRDSDAKNPSESVSYQCHWKRETF